jgi:hypothetical protein
MSSITIEEYAHDLVQDVLATADANNESPHDAFAGLVLQDLEAAGILDEQYVAYYRSHGIEVSGYGRNEPIGSLDIFLVSFRQHPLLAKAGKTELSTMAKRVLAYLAKADSGLSRSIDESDDAHDMALACQQYLPEASSIRVFLVTNDVATTRSLPDEDFKGRPVTFEVWDLVRLHRLATSGVLHEPITVKFEEPLPCLATQKTEENYSVLLAIVPGQTLAKVYAEYGARLLELNVRSFLQLKGAVNRGIRETLINRPERFLAYNNGISATASKVTLVEMPDGGTGIATIQDLQIVNGGQTTASLHHAYAKDRLDLTSVLVQMKLTVVQPDLLDVIVPEISKFSNTQNKVTLTDFSSNHKYHVELEKLSRTLWAPAASGTGQETKWFYERARGQYADALSKERTPGAKSKFRITYPTKQKFTKTDVAKWEMSWDQKPQIVSRGGEKNFRAFMDTVGGDAPTSDVGFVQRLIAKGILFRDTEKIVTAQNFGGYRANIVAYGIAKLSHEMAMRIDFDRIWAKQGVSEALAAALTDLSHLVYKVIIDPPRGTTNVGEWAKRDACWAKVLEVPWSAPPALEKELLDVSKAKKVEREAQQAAATEESAADAAVVKSLSAESWFSLAKWAKETGNLLPWQRSLAFSLGKVLAGSGEPSVKQSHQGAIIVHKALSLGFRP